MAGLEPKVADEAAVKAIARGEADPEQQKRAFEFIVNEACATYDMSFHETSDRATAFCEGKRYVGNQLVKLAKRQRKKKDVRNERGSGDRTGGGAGNRTSG